MRAGKRSIAGTKRKNVERHAFRTPQVPISWKFFTSCRSVFHPIFTIRESKFEYLHDDRRERASLPRFSILARRTRASNHNG
jgi:hypothetical protein